MNKNSSETLVLDSLIIGYRSGKTEDHLLSPITASADKGELIAIIGRNGIGKSTLLRTLTGLQPALGGEIYIEGKNLREYSKIELALQVGYISTENIKVDNMSVYDLVAIGRFPHTNWMGKIDRINHEVIMEVLEKTSMSALQNRFVSELSDGERQRAMIARILAQDTKIMVMDEPTAFLDIGSKFEILHLLNLLSRENRKTIIFSTHDLHLAVSQADKIWLVINDKLLEGAPEDLMIEGSFDHLFDNSHVKFNSEQVSFSLIGEENDRIYIEGSGHMKYWTEKAINRLGFSLSEEVTSPYIIVPSGLNTKWQLLSGSSSVEFGSIYELVRWLGKYQNKLPD